MGRLVASARAQCPVRGSRGSLEGTVSTRRPRQLRPLCATCAECLDSRFPGLLGFESPRSPFGLGMAFALKRVEMNFGQSRTRHSSRFKVSFLTPISALWPTVACVIALGLNSCGTDGPGGSSDSSGGERATGGATTSSGGGAVGGAAGSLAGASGGPELLVELLDVEHGDGLFVAVGAVSPDTVNARAESYVVTSEDGRVWEQRYREPGVLLYSVAFGDGQWLATGSHLYDTDGGFQSTVQLLHSEDGIVWSPIAAPDAKSLYEIAWTGELFVLAGDDFGSTLVWTSEDGIEWVEADVPDIGGERPSLATQNGTVVLGASVIATSNDHGRTWARVLEQEGGSWVHGLWKTKTGLSGGYSTDCCFGETGQRKDYLLESIDGSSWVKEPVARDSFIQGFAWSDEVEVAIDGEARLVHRAADGAWTAESSERYSDVIYAEGVFVAVGLKPTASRDGKTWQQGTVHPEL